MLFPFGKIDACAAVVGFLASGEEENEGENESGEEFHGIPHFLFIEWAYVDYFIYLNFCQQQ